MVIGMIGCGRVMVSAVVFRLMEADLVADRMSPSGTAVTVMAAAASWPSKHDFSERVPDHDVALYRQYNSGSLKQDCRLC